MTYYEAVIFDYFGTLTHMLSPTAFSAGLKPLGEVLGVATEDLEQMMHESFSERCRGQWGTFEETMVRLAQELDVQLSGTDLEEACRVRLDSQWELVSNLRNDAVPVLEAIRSMGPAVGLISDCTHELPMLWPKLPVAPLVDVSLFSVEVGVKKPDPSLYVSAARQLGVAENRCLYVGDGGSDEMEGARAVGMHPVLLDNGDSRDAVVYGRVDWRGPSIQELDEVPDLIESRYA